jgi:hypothetical protein
MDSAKSGRIFAPIVRIFVMAILLQASAAIQISALCIG